MQELSSTDQSESGYFNLQVAAAGRRYRLAGQQALRLSLAAGDRLLLQGSDGEQVCELLALDSEGRAAPHLLGGRRPEPSVGLRAQLAGDGSAARRLQAQLREWGVVDQQLETVVRIDTSEPVTLQAQGELTLVIAAAAADMSVEQQAPPTDVALTLTPANPPQEVLPEPLAPVKSELRVKRATARTYEVKAGEWIQIIDVAGKQCSDFLAFDRQALEQGHEVGLDALATRTVLGHSNPAPGLWSRFLGSDMTSLVEVVQDTVGRHDSFLLACTPRYYEDSGYFGHVSCSDNFNRVLAPYDIRPRPGWPAINFFFNTEISPCGAVLMDEPWSRPGDYVLLRATRDLLCASSACPDDIDPANGWQPTDIHVRIYDAGQQFPRAVAHRITPEELPRMTETTGFHSRVAALTKKLTEYRGYWVATEYEGWGTKAEYLACRERVAMIDLSPLRKFEVTGPDAEAFLQYVLTRNVRRLAVGEIAYSALCYETGGMMDDGTIFRMGEQAFRWVCGDPYSGIWMRKQAKEKGYRVSIRNSTSQLHNIAVQGPESRRLLSELIWTPETQPSMASLAWFHFLIGRLGGPTGTPVMVSRTGYTGELGFEVWCHPDNAEQLWDAVWERGQAFDIAPMGFDALDMLRIEAGLIFADHEFCPQTNPFEAGIGFTVPMKTKEENFIGREAMARQAPESRQRLMGLVLEGGDGAAHGDHVYLDRCPVGVVTSATPSPLMGKQIALCRLAPEYAEPGTRLQVGKLDGHQKRIDAQVVSLPFHDPERTRVRS